MMRLFAVPALLLAGCATDSAPPPPVVDIPIVQACTPNLDPPPAYPDTDEALSAAATVFDQVRLLLGGRTLRIARESALSKALRDCAG